MEQRTRGRTRAHLRTRIHAYTHTRIRAHAREMGAPTPSVIKNRRELAEIRPKARLARTRKYIYSVGTPGAAARSHTSQLYGAARTSQLIGIHIVGELAGRMEKAWLVCVRAVESDYLTIYNTMRTNSFSLHYQGIIIRSLIAGGFLLVAFCIAHGKSAVTTGIDSDKART